MTIPIIDFVGCELEQDETWNVTWPATQLNGVATQKCPGGSEATGNMCTKYPQCMLLYHTEFATRKCVGEDVWASPNVSQCQTIEQIRLMMRALELLDLVNNTFVADDRDMTVMFMPVEIIDITNELNEITDTNVLQPLLPNDISSSAEILNIIITYVCMYVSEHD